jgi:hypothetical protein
VNLSLIQCRALRLVLFADYTPYMKAVTQIELNRDSGFFENIDLFYFLNSLFQRLGLNQLKQS